MKNYKKSWVDPPVAHYINFKIVKLLVFGIATFTGALPQRWLWRSVLLSHRSAKRRTELRLNCCLFGLLQTWFWSSERSPFPGLHFEKASNNFWKNTHIWMPFGKALPMASRSSRSSSAPGIIFILRTDPHCLLRGCCLVGRLFQFYTEEYCSPFLSSNVLFALSVLSISPISRLHVYLSYFKVIFGFVELAVIFWLRNRGQQISDWCCGSCVLDYMLVVSAPEILPM